MFPVISTHIRVHGLLTSYILCTDMAIESTYLQSLWPAYTFIVLIWCLMPTTQAALPSVRIIVRYVMMTNNTGWPNDAIWRHGSYWTWLRQRLVAWLHQNITWINVTLSSIRSNIFEKNEKNHQRKCPWKYSLKMAGETSSLQNCVTFYNRKI